MDSTIEKNQVNIEDEMKRSYLDYAMSVIVGRALPDVRDGLKPVHRRVLWAMQELGNYYNKPYKKSARVVGDTIGKYHPHGDTAVYDTVVRMAQDFSMRYPLVEGQGNFGCFTGDTKIKMLDGSDKTFAELAELPKDEIFYVYSVNKEGEVVIGEGRFSRITKKNAELVEVELDNGNKIRCTPDHRFLLRNGTYKEAEDLTKEDSLFAGYFDKTPVKKGLNEYLQVWQPNLESYEFVHVLADKFNDEKGLAKKIDGAFVRHHKNFDRFDNRPTNIERMDFLEHLHLHAEQIGELWKDEDFRKAQRKGVKKYYAENPEVVEEGRERFVEQNKDADFRKQNGKKVSKSLKARYARNPELREEISLRMKEPSAKSLKKKWQDDEYKKQVLRKRFAKYGSQLIREFGADSVTPELYANKRNANWIPRVEKVSDYFENFDEFVEVSANFNHRIVSVKYLNEKTDVYDITVDEHHNFLLADEVFVHNSVDGDSAAAMRYTEIRMEKLTNAMLSDIEKETVDFQANYDESLSEPIVLPTRVPTLLINGSEGIAVGMATKIPPHCLTEIVDGVSALLDNPGTTIDELIELIPGPDFPTGGFIYGREEIHRAYKTGRGIVKMRAKALIDILGNGKRERNAIIITEIPYQLNKAKLIEKIAELVNNKRLEGISEIRDESSREGMRIVVELKRDSVPQVVLNKMFKLTALQSSFGIIMIAIVDGQPKVLNIKQILEAFIEFRREVVRRRTEYELKKAQARAHILEGLKKAIDALDYIIPLIRNSSSVAEAKEWMTGKFPEKLDTRNWKGLPASEAAATYAADLQQVIKGLNFSEIQAQAILDLQLRRLSALEHQKILDEYEGIIKFIAELENILNNEKVLRHVIKEELQEVKQMYGDERRTIIVDAGVELNIEDLIPDEEVAITVTKAGYVKRTPIATYSKQTRGGKGRLGATAKDEDFVQYLFTASTHDYLMVFTNDGQVYKVRVHEIPEALPSARGKAIVNLVSIPSASRLVTVLPVRDFSDDAYLMMVTKKGVIKKTALSQYQNIRVNGINAINIDKGDELLDVIETDGSKQILIATHEGMAIRFDEKDARPMGRVARGTRGIRLKKNDYAVGVCAIVDEDQKILTISEQGFGKRTDAGSYRLIKRGGKGVINMKTTEKTGKVVASFPVEDDSEIMIITEQAKLIRIGVENVRETGRSAQGVMLIRTNKNDLVTSASLLDIDEKEEVGLTDVELDLNEEE